LTIFVPHHNLGIALSCRKREAAFEASEVVFEASKADCQEPETVSSSQDLEEALMVLLDGV
jgi:hypothetical protein